MCQFDTVKQGINVHGSFPVFLSLELRYIGTLYFEEKIDILMTNIKITIEIEIEISNHF